MTVRVRMVTAVVVVLSAAFGAASAEGPEPAHTPQQALGLLKKIS